MTLLAPLAILTGLALEISAIRNPTSTPLKLAATVASIAYLFSFIVFKPGGPFTSVWPLGMNIYCLAQRCWNYLWLKDTSKFHRRDTKQSSTSKEDKSEIATSHSVLDALDIALAFRGVGWSFEAKGLPKRLSPNGSWLYFAYSQLLGAFVQFIILDVAITFVNATYSAVDSASFPSKLLMGGVMLLHVRWTMDIPYRIASVISILSGVTCPQDWPPLFGAWQDAYTIRRFWSHTWHQGMRLLAEPPMEFLANDLLKFPRGSYLNKWTKIFGNFFIACLDHAYGRVIAGGDPNSDWSFFAIQPVAIWVEETIRDGLVAYGWLNARDRTMIERWLGYFWTACFQSWTFLYFMEGAIRIVGNVPEKNLIDPVFGLSLVKLIL